jgi:hypothetical protein
MLKLLACISIYPLASPLFGTADSVARPNRRGSAASTWASLLACARSVRRQLLRLSGVKTRQPFHIRLKAVIRRRFGSTPDHVFFAALISKNLFRTVNNGPIFSLGCLQFFSAPNHLYCQWFEDLTFMKPPRFLCQGSELLNNCVNQILCQGGEKDEAAVDELL